MTLRSRNGMLSVFLIIFLSACSKDDNSPNPGTGKIETGAFSEVLNDQVGTSGKLLSIQGSLLDGLTLEIPKDAYPSNKNFTISVAEIKSHTFGPDFNPITPMIRINNGGGYSDSILTLTIHCEVSKDHFAMGFFYDEETGELEGIPVLSITDNFVVLATRHFSGKHLNEGAGSLTARTKIWTNILISSMQKDKLFELQESGFRPGIDDWEFPNEGSYIAPKGHCSGQSLAAMWYYSVHKLNLNEAPLFGRFSTVTSPIWQDNVKAYRFVSAVHVDGSHLWNQGLGPVNVFDVKFNNQGPKNLISYDSLHYLGFAYSIRLTKKPQYVYILSNTGLAHAMIVYRTNLNVLSIADPNFPSQYAHSITLSNGKFLPYESKQNATAPTTLFENIKYFAKSALITSEGVAAHYVEMLSGTIGSQPPYFFPPSQLIYYDGKEWVDLPDTLSTEYDSIIIAARCFQCVGKYPGDLTTMKLLKTNGETSVLTDEKGYLHIPLVPGENLLPLEIFGSPDGVSWAYLDFKMPVIKKEPKAGFGYWLKQLLDDHTLGASFGYKTMQGQFAGKWLGTTYKVDYQKDFDIDGRHGTVFAKYTANCNSNRTLINSFNIELWTLEGSTKGVIISLDGVNLPLSSSEGTNLVFSAYGPAACSTLTRVDYFVAGQPAKYGCDETSFVFFTIPKP